MIARPRAPPSSCRQSVGFQNIFHLTFGHLQKNKSWYSTVPSTAGGELGRIFASAVTDAVSFWNSYVSKHGVRICTACGEQGMVKALVQTYNSNECWLGCAESDHIPGDKSYPQKHIWTNWVKLMEKPSINGHPVTWTDDSGTHMHEINNSEGDLVGYHVYARAILEHEFGHTLGLDDRSSNDTIMGGAAVIGEGYGVTAVQPEDAAVVEKLYRYHSSH